MPLHSLIPKRFLCYYSLKLGALFTGILMSGVAVASVTVLFVQLLKMDVTSCQKLMWRAAYSFNITAIVYNVIIITLNLVLIWAVLKAKLVIMLCWLIITGVWLAQTFLLLIVLLCMHSLEASLVAWIMSVIFGLMAVGILVYLSMVVFGYWLEIKLVKEIKPSIIVASNNTA